MHTRKKNWFCRKKDFNYILRSKFWTRIWILWTALCLQKTWRTSLVSNNDAWEERIVICNNTKQTHGVRVFVWVFWLHHTLDTGSCSSVFSNKTDAYHHHGQTESCCPFSVKQFDWDGQSAMVAHHCPGPAWGCGAMHCLGRGEKNPKVRKILHISWHGTACCMWNSNLIQWYKCYLTKTFLILLYLDCLFICINATQYHHYGLL